MNHDNILGLESPDQWKGHVLTYSQPSILELRLFGPVTRRNTLIIRFASIKYFCGPISWKGANFKLGSREECWRLMQQYPALSKDYLLRTYRLYQIVVSDGSKLDLQIIASFSVEIEQSGTSRLVDLRGAYD